MVFGSFFIPVWPCSLFWTKLGEESGAALVEALAQNSTLTLLDVGGNDAISPATQAKIKFALSPELKNLLNDPSVSPSRIPVCVVGFDNVGKTELVNTWHRTTTHENPHLDPEETAEAKSDDERDKTSGISIKPVTLRLDATLPALVLETPTKSRRIDGIPKMVDIIAWDFAGHTQYYLSHELLMRACRGAVFVLLFRIDRLKPDVSNVSNAEQERLFFWLKFIASMCSNQQQPPTVFIGGSFRPDDDSFDVEGTTKWTDGLLRTIKAVFGGVLNLPQHSIYHMDCRKSKDLHVVALRNMLAQTAEEIRTGEDRKVPPICEYATSLLHNATAGVTSKLVSFAEHMKIRLLNPNMPVQQLSWEGTVCGPVMTHADFEEHVLGKLEVNADEIGANIDVDEDAYSDVNDDNDDNGDTDDDNNDDNDDANDDNDDNDANDANDDNDDDNDADNDDNGDVNDDANDDSDHIANIDYDDINAYEDYSDDNDDSSFDGEPTIANPTVTPKSKQLRQIITSYLHDVGDILWFDVDDLRDTVILTPDLFCSKIIGGIFRPDAPGFSIDAVHGGGALVPKSNIAATFKHALGIDDAHVDAALAILCQLGLCHRHQDDETESYLFPGALAATSYRRPEWFGPLAPGENFVVGRRFTLVDPATTIFIPGWMSAIQVWALGRYKGSMIWRDGVIIPYTTTGTLAEAGVQLHRPYSSSHDGDKCAQISMSSITLIVRGSDEESSDDCLELLNTLCDKIRTVSGVRLVEETLPPSELAKSSTNNSNMLDVTCPGFTIPPNLDPAIRGVIVGGKKCTINNLKFGSFVDVPHHVQSTPTPNSWMGKDFEPASARTPNGGADLIVEIPRDHADFTRIETNMRRSMPHVVIRKIQRVQNRALWNKYFPARCDIAMDREDGSPNEIEAWHSTGRTDPWLICSDWKAGFDVNRSVIEIQYVQDNMGQLTRGFRNVDNKSYGTGVYLAEHCIYSDTILPHVRPINQDKQIILAKVTLGNNFNYGKTLPDRKSAIEPEGYHSISGTEGDMQFLLQQKQNLVVQGRWSPAWEELVAKGGVFGRQYVVHRSNQVYPAYLVTYE